MTSEEWDLLTVEVQAYWPNRAIPDESFDLWFRDLDEFDVEQVHAAVNALYRDGREWAPNGAIIRNKLIELRTDAPDHGKAYELTMEAAGPRGGFNTGLAWLREKSPLAALAAERYGWRDFCYEDTPDGVRRGQYREIFQSVANRVERDQRYLGIEGGGLKALESDAGPKKLGQIIELPRTA